MNPEHLDPLIEALLYEGHILYPYRPSSTKNCRGRFTFGRVYPEAYSAAQKGAERCVMQTEGLVLLFPNSLAGGEEVAGCRLQVAGWKTAPEPNLQLSTCNLQPFKLHVSVRFLQPMAREIGVLDEPLAKWTGAEPQCRRVPELRVGEEWFQSWHEAVERRVELSLGVPPSGGTAPEPPEGGTPNAGRSSRRSEFSFPPRRSVEPIRDGARVVGVIVRRQARISGAVEIAACPAGSGLFKITVRILNQSPLSTAELGDEEAVLLRTLASTHTLLRVEGGEFVSLLEPAPEFKAAAEACENLGVWPVLVGDGAARERDTMLSSPILLYDYPKIAPESPGSLFDGTEIDELLSLRILTLTPEEKRKMRCVDEQARRLLERTEGLPQESLLRMHGTLRDDGGGNPKAEGRGPKEGRDPKSEAAGGAFGASVRQLERRGAKDAEKTMAAGQPHPGGILDTTTKLEQVSVGGVSLRAGDRVRIRPKARADVMDLALSGQMAVIEAIEEDVEHRIYLAVVLENDPGKDLGLLRQPGHRFFYGVDEVEPI
jgi:hydrogenase maturation protease